VAADGETVYVAQSDYAADAPTELRAYERTGPSALGSYAVLHDFHPHRGVDGMCLTERGSVVACAGSTDGGPGPAVYEFDPDGTVVNRHPVPGEAPTNCAFGGPSLSELYVCTHGGDLYRAETDRTGLLGAPASPVLPAP
jgi:gluconolactonase